MFDVITNNVAPLKFKTNGLNKTEWRKILTESENIRLTKAMKLIDSDMSWLTFTVNSNIKTVDSDAADIGKAGVTYRDLLRDSFARYNEASDLDVKNSDLISGVSLQAIVGLLDDASREPIILQGLPIN